jgi:hypothetical protein
MPRYKLRTLLLLLAMLPPLLAVGWSRYSAWRADQDRRAAIERGLKEVNASLNMWMKAQPGPQLDPEQREVAILQLEEHAAVLQGRRGSAALENLVKRLREVQPAEPNP